MILSAPLVKYALTAAVRDKLVISLLVVVGLTASISVFLGSAAVTESDQFALVFASGGLRIVSVLGLVLFIGFYIRRAFEAKEVEYLLSRPVSRTSFILSHTAAFSIVAALLAAIITLVIFWMSSGTWGAGHALWSFSILVELIIMANAALFFAMVLPSAVASVLATGGLYILARLMGQILGIVDTGGSVMGIEFLNFMMQGVSLIIPRLDLMGQTSWLIYGETTVSCLMIAAQGLIYTGLLISAALFDLIRRQF